MSFFCRLLRFIGATPVTALPADLDYFRNTQLYLSANIRIGACLGWKRRAGGDRRGAEEPYGVKQFRRAGVMSDRDRGAAQSGAAQIGWIRSSTHRLGAASACPVASPGRPAAVGRPTECWVAGWQETMRTAVATMQMGGNGHLPRCHFMIRCCHTARSWCRECWAGGLLYL